MDKHLSDSLIGAVLLALVAFAYGTSRSFPEKSQFFVNILLAALLVLTLIYLARSLWNIARARQEGHGGERIRFFNEKNWGGIGFFAVYIFLMIPGLGFYSSTALFTFGLSWFLGTRQVKALAAAAVAFPLILYFIFQVALGVYLPAGMLI